MPTQKKASPVRAKTTKKTGGAPGAMKARGGGKSKTAGRSSGAGYPKVGKLSNPVGPKNDGSTATRTAALRAVVIGALDDMKALEVKVLDVRGLTDVADIMVIASGTSDRHVRSVAKNVVEKTKAAGFRPHGVEGQQDSDWVLIDLHEMIVHVMLPRTREFYGLEKLWDMTETKRAARV